MTAPASTEKAAATEPSRVAQALKDAALAGVLAVGLFLPLVGFQTVTNMRNELVLETRWPLLAAVVATVIVGRLLYTLFLFPWIAARVGRPASLRYRLDSSEDARRVTWKTWATLFAAGFVAAYPALVMVIGGGQGALKWIDNFGIQILIYVMLGWGLNIVVGLAGLLDLGYVAFYAVGAYSYALLAKTFGLSFWILLPLAGIMAAFWGLLLGFPVLRLRGDYLAIVTLAFGEIVPIFIRNLGGISISIGPWPLLQNANLTNGVQGLNPVGRPWIGGFEFGFDPAPWYYLILIIAVLVIFTNVRLQDSRLGRAWMALREDETAADCIGVDPVRTKLLAFAIGASFSGFAGAFYAAKLQAIFPELFRFNLSIMILCMVILGGMGSIRGVIIGGLLIQLFDRVVLAQTTVLAQNLGRTLSIEQLMTVDLGLWRWFFFGLTMVVIMVFRPEGLFPSAAGRRQLHAEDEDEAVPAPAVGST
jgi:branched-chain amino acid transport system permease protein